MSKRRTRRLMLARLMRIRERVFRSTRKRLGPVSPARLMVNYEAITSTVKAPARHYRAVEYYRSARARIAEPS